MGDSSRFGYLGFENYIYNLDTGILNPFISKEEIITSAVCRQGYKIDKDEMIILNDSLIMTPYNFKDIFMFEHRDQNNTDNIHYEKVIYYLDGHTAVSDYNLKNEMLELILDLFEEQRIYYSMLLMKNSDNKNPIEVAIDNNSPRTVELLLNHLMKLQEFNLSRSLYKRFIDLFKLKIRAFDKFLDVSFFQTPQMLTIKKLKLNSSNNDQPFLEANNTSLLDSNFEKRFVVGGTKKKRVREKKIKKEKTQEQIDADAKL